MKNPYDKYLERLQGRMGEDPFTKQARLNSRQLNPAWTRNQTKLDSMYNRGQLTPGARAQASIESAQAQATQISNIYDQAGVRDVQRREQLRTQIDETEMKRDQMDEQIKAQEDQAKYGLWKAIGTGVGAVGGSLIAPGVGIIRYKFQ
jgi:hypothetical protein